MTNPLGRRQADQYAPSPFVLGTLSVLVALLAVFVCVLYALTPDGEKGELLGNLAPIIGGAVLGLPAVVAALTGRQLRAQLGRVEHQTNGHLTDRLDQLRSDIVTEVAQLVPPQRPAEPPADAEPWFRQPPPHVTPHDGGGLEVVDDTAPVTT